MEVFLPEVLVPLCRAKCEHSENIKLDVNWYRKITISVAVGQWAAGISEHGH